MHILALVAVWKLKMVMTNYKNWFHLPNNLIIRMLVFLTKKTMGKDLRSPFLKVIGTLSWANVVWLKYDESLLFGKLFTSPFFSFTQKSRNLYLVEAFFVDKMGCLPITLSPSVHNATIALNSLWASSILKKPPPPYRECERGQQICPKTDIFPQVCVLTLLSAH